MRSNRRPIPGFEQGIIFGTMIETVKILLLPPITIQFWIFRFQSN
jgi:hypothetical protein